MLRNLEYEEILMRLYPFQKGRILIGGKDITKMNQLPI